MVYIKGEQSGGESNLVIRQGEIQTYLNMRDYQRTGQELPDISQDERNFLAQMVRDIYTMAKGEPDAAKRLKLMARFNDALALILCDSRERKMAFGPPENVELTVLHRDRDHLVFGTGTYGERVFFRTYSGQEHPPGRYMQYPVPGDSAKELGRKYFNRFCETFGGNIVNLDTGSVEFGSL